MSAFKKHTEKIIAKSEYQVNKRIDKVYERVIEAEARDATQEREQKQGMDKLIDSVKKQQNDHFEKIQEQLKKYLGKGFDQEDGMTGEHTVTTPSYYPSLQSAQES